MEFKNRCGSRGGTLRWKGNTYLVILWILVDNFITKGEVEFVSAVEHVSGKGFLFGDGGGGLGTLDTNFFVHSFLYFIPTLAMFQVPHLLVY